MRLAVLSLTFAMSTISVPAAAQIGEPRAVVPVVGSTQGAFGSNFRTSLQLHNRTDREMRGSMVVRPAGATSDAANRSLPYVLAPHQTIWFQDIVASAGVEGLGSMDFVVDEGGVPTIVARAYNDAGESGTTGVSVRPVAPKDALLAGDSAALLIPADLGRFRFNIGVRALGEGARMMVLVYDADGTIEANLGMMSFAPHSFAQQPASNFLGGRVLAPNQSIGFQMLEGAAIIYGTSTDNITNDPSLQIVRSVDE